MRHSNKQHLLGMFGVPAALFLVLVAFGQPLGQAFFISMVVACPLHMIMMLGGHRSHAEPTDPHRRHPQASAAHDIRQGSSRAGEGPQDRVHQH